MREPPRRQVNLWALASADGVGVRAAREAPRRLARLGSGLRGGGAGLTVARLLAYKEWSRSDTSCRQDS